MTDLGSLLLLLKLKILRMQSHSMSRAFVVISSINHYHILIIKKKVGRAAGLVYCGSGIFTS